METRVRVMGLEIDVLPEETLQSQLNEYLTNDYLNIVHIVSVDYAEEEPSDEVRMAHAEADLILPGEKAVLNAHHGDVLEAGGMVVDCHSILNVIRNTPVAGKKVYYVMRNKNEAKGFYGLIQGSQLGVDCVGIHVEEGNITEEALINDINTLLPDIVVVGLEKETQEKWILENRQKINAKLCVCIGGILPLIRGEISHVPKLFQLLHAGEVYKKIRKIPNSHSLRSRIFKQKMAKYNNKKQNED